MKARRSGKGEASSRRVSANWRGASAPLSGGNQAAFGSRTAAHARSQVRFWESGPEHLIEWLRENLFVTQMEDHFFGGG